MTDGTKYEYDLSMDDVNAFITWYDGKSSGTGKAEYHFNKTDNKGPFQSRTDYLTHDKIQSFQVNQYNTASSTVSK